jgi:predicted PurR-regulated permease PerM
MVNDTMLERLLSRKLLDVLIQAGLIVALVAICYRIFSPFLTMMLWALILAVTLYPLHQLIAKRLGRKQGWASTTLVLMGIALIVIPVVRLGNSLSDSITYFLDAVRDNTLVLPVPSDEVASWPVVGEKLHAVWHQAATDLPSLIHSLQPKFGELSKRALSLVANTGGEMLKFFFSFIIAGVIMAYGKDGAGSALAISRRLVGNDLGHKFAELSTATIRAVAQGVIGIAFIQAIVLGLALMFAHIPFATILAVVALVLGIAQLPTLLITLPAIVYIWLSGSYETLPAVLYSVLLVIASMVDNVLKPLLLGRGVDAPMPVILLGALGGMVSAGILGMFVGSVILALGYQIFMVWVGQQNAADAPHLMEGSAASEEK